MPRSVSAEQPSAAYLRDKRSGSLFSVRYDRYFEEELETLRADLRVQAG